MKTKLFLSVFTIFVLMTLTVNSQWTCGMPFTDPRDNATYTTGWMNQVIPFNAQQLPPRRCWFTQNLNYGVMINSTTTPQNPNNGIPERYCFQNNVANCGVYGGLYTWNELMSMGDLCPLGWHVPTKDEWEKLLGGYNGRVPPLKALVSWNPQPNWPSTNTSGFTALASGKWINRGAFVWLGIMTRFWSSTEKNNGSSWGLNLPLNVEITFIGSDIKADALSARCIRDETE